MKVAVSIPDPLFERADALARRLKLSRSKVYARALDEFVANNSADSLTAAINAAIDTAGDDDLGPFVREAGRRVLKLTDW